MKRRGENERQWRGRKDGEKQIERKKERKRERERDTHSGQDMERETDGVRKKEREREKERETHSVQDGDGERAGHNVGIEKSTGKCSGNGVYYHV